MLPSAFMIAAWLITDCSYAHADFFTSCINVPLPIAVLIMLVGYSLSFLVWGCVWYALYR